MGVFVDRSKSCKSKDAKTRKKNQKGFKHPSTKGAAIFGMCRKELLQASIDIFVTKNASRFADDLAMGTGIQNPPSKKGASPMGKK